MPASKRHRTEYTGVFYIESKSSGSTIPEKVFYIRYRRDGRQVEEKAGREKLDHMTASKAFNLRNNKINAARSEFQQHKSNTLLENKLNTDRWTVDRLWEKYAAERINIPSIKSDFSRYNRYIKTNIGHKELADLSLNEIETLKNHLLKTKSSQTVKHVLGIIKRLNNYSLKNNIAPGISFALHMPVVKSQNTIKLTNQQISLLFQAINESGYIESGAMLKLALFTGMRRNELFSLKWENVDLRNGLIHQRGTDNISYTIPVNEPAKKVLSALPRLNSFLFSCDNSKKRNDIIRQINEIKNNAGLPKEFKPLQGLRETYAVLLASSGKVDLYTLQKLLSLKSPQMTKKYAHLVDKPLHRAGDLVGDIIEEALPAKESKREKNEKEREIENINNYDISKKKLTKNTKKQSDKNRSSSITTTNQLNNS